MGKSPLNVVFGAGNIGDTSVDPIARYDTPEQVNGILDIFYARGYCQIDTARIYSPHAPGSSEPRLGAIDATSKFLVDTKVLSREPGSHTKEKIRSEIDASLAALQTRQIHIEYLHMPDRSTPFEQACEAMDQAVKQGKIKHWGVSNYTAAEVQQILDICENKGFVKPFAYQGQYNILVRGGEKELFPVLRKHNIAFYAYSPAGAGFFAGNHKNVKAGGRFDKSTMLGQIYAKNYENAEVDAATDRALAIAAEKGIGGHAAALRWVIYHSILDAAHGDSVIIGASSAEQLTSNLDMIEQGPLPDDVVAALEAVHKKVGDAISYHM